MLNTPGKNSALPREHQETLLGRKLHDGEYYVERVLGHGGMGKVYLVTHTSLKTPFALKQARADQPLPEEVIAELDYVLQGGDLVHHAAGSSEENDFPSSGGTHTDRFLREALLLTRLQHPAIPTLYDYFFQDGYWYLVMDYIPGSALSVYLRQHAPLPSLEALNYAIQICDMLDYLHKQTPPIIFRDLKPSNIILTPDGALMLVDFGIARYFKTGQVNDTMDFGSPGYAPPEQYQGEGQTDGRSDLYSLGVILHEMITGKRPLTIGCPLISPRELNANVSAALSGLITLATRSDPHFRFQTAHAFYMALERAYTIEEQLAYQRHILTLQNREQAAEAIVQPLDKQTIQGGEDATKTERTANENVIEQELEKAPIQSARLSESIIAPFEMPIIPRLSFDLEQRHQTREALQQARRERLEQENLEIQLASVDESLKRRSFVLMSQSSQAIKAAVEKPEETNTTVPPKRNIRRIIQLCFLLTLVLFLALASLVTYIRFAHHFPIFTQGHQTYPTPSDTSPFKSSWQVLPSLPSTEADNTSIYVQSGGQNYIYMSGGYRGNRLPSHYDRDLYRYDIASAHWETIPHGHFPGMLNNAVARDEQGNLFFTAGYSTDAYKLTSLLYMYQPSNGSLRTLTPPASASSGYGMAMLADQQGHLYLTEGYTSAGNPQTLAGSGWYRYDIATNHWQTLAPLLQGLGYVLLASDGNGNILLQGGASDAGQLHQSRAIYRYNIAQNRWFTETAPIPQALSGAASCLIGPGKMVVIGGYDASKKKGLAATWLVDLLTLHWTRLASLPSGGSVLGSAACDKRGHIYLERGANDPSHPTPDFWLLTLQARR